MSKKLAILASLVALIGPADYARADVVIFKVDFSCPGQ